MNQKTASYFGLLTKCSVALLALTLLLTPKFSSAQTGGTLDASFGTNGKVTTDFGGTFAAALTLAAQADGKILAAGVAGFNGGTDFALARFNANGTLDASFGTSGKVTTAFDFPGSFDRVFTVVLQPDGKFVAVGSTVINQFANFALARFNANGTLDASFGTGGIVTTGFGVSAEATSVAVQADGKIVAAGFANLDGADDFALVRYNSNGTLDGSFGTGGKVTTAFALSQGFSQAQANSVAVQPDGRIVAAGNAVVGGGFDFALARYNSNGTLDASFGSGGRLTTDFAGANDQADSVAVQPDGRIVAAGAAGPYINRGLDFALARYNSNGTLDTSFGTGGKVTTDFAGASDLPSEPSAVALQGDGKIVVVGQTLVGGFYNFALACFNSNGTLDASFGTGGKVTTNFASADDVPFSVAVQPDGNIVVAGGATINGRSDFALARYVGSAVLSTPDIDTAPASLDFGNVTQGSFKNLAVTVRNTGTATLNVTSTTLLGTAEYSIVAGGGAFSLAPNATRQVTVRLTPTSLGSKVATLSFASNDTDENPKNVPLSGTGVASSDLVVSALTGPATAGAGFAITLNETTGNIGVGLAGGTSTRYYLSIDTSIGAGDVLLGGRSLAGLAPGGSSAGATNVTIPAGTANGSYFIVARADDLNQAFESNEGNNTRALAIRIGPATSSSTSLTSSLNPSTFGVAVTFTATVNSTGGTPTGTVTFKDGVNTLGTGTLSSGKAIFQTSTLAAGAHSITAAYGGTTSFASSTSAVLTQTVNQPSSTGTPIVYRSATLPAVSSGPTFRTFTFSGFPDTTGTILDATAVGNSVTFTVNVATARTYDIKLSYKQNTNRGISQLSINSTNVGAPLDQYLPTEGYAIVDYGNFTFPTAGNYSFKFIIVGKNANSTSFGVSFDDFTLTPQ